MYMLGRHIQCREHNSVEDARASMDLFKCVQSDWKTEVEPDRKLLKSLKRSRTEDSLQSPASGQQCVKRTRLDSDSMLFLSDDYWPDDIQVCWF